MGVIKLPLPQGAGEDFPVVHYDADDTLLIMEASRRQLLALKALLHASRESTWLKVNYNKSIIVPINMDNDRMEILANTIGCKVGQLPFTYLGLPLSVTKPRVADFMPMVERIERRLTSTTIFLSQSGKLEMVKSIFSFLPTYYICTLKLPATIVKQVEHYMIVDTLSLEGIRCEQQKTCTCSLESSYKTQKARWIGHKENNSSE